MGSIEKVCRFITRDLHEADPYGQLDFDRY